MKITIYKLLEMIKDGKPPKKIKINESILNLKIAKNTSYEFETGGGVLSFDYYIENNKLDTIVEIIEEDKKIEHVENYVDFANLNDAEKFDYLYEMEFRIIDKINEMENK